MMILYDDDGAYVRYVLTVLYRSAMVLPSVPECALLASGIAGWK